MIKKCLAVATVITMFVMPLPSFATESDDVLVNDTVIQTQEINPENEIPIEPEDTDQSEEMTPVEFNTPEEEEMIETETSQEPEPILDPDLEESISAEINLPEEPETDELLDTQEPVIDGDFTEPELPEIDEILDTQEPVIDELESIEDITPEIEELVVEEYNDLKIKQDTKIYLTLADGQTVKLSPDVRGGDNITIKIYSNDDLVGEINNGTITFAIEFTPTGNVFIAISGNPGSQFDVQFSFSAIEENTTDIIESTEPITPVEESNVDPDTIIDDFDDIIEIPADVPNVDQNKQPLDWAQTVDAGQGNANLPD